MPNVKEERLESSLFIMDGVSGAGESGNEPTTPVNPAGSPRHL